MFINNLLYDLKKIIGYSNYHGVPQILKYDLSYAISWEIPLDTQNEGSKPPTLKSLFSVIILWIFFVMTRNTMRHPKLLIMGLYFDTMRKYYLTPKIQLTMRLPSVSQNLVNNRFTIINWINVIFNNFFLSNSRLP